MFYYQFNKLAAQGWELVSIFTTHQENGRSGEAMAVFKRLRSGVAPLEGPPARILKS
ncbi:MAG: DUF4177 domain-containing protein [Spartobacteria bacterium]